jgi:SSS family solute:Na+ symporter
MDVYRRVHPGAAEKTLVRVGQGATVVLVGLGLAWIPLMKLISGQLYQYLQSVQAYIAPPITAVFVLGIAWRRVNAAGAMAALGTGFVLGTTRLVLELNKGWLSEGWLLDAVSLNFLHFAVVLFAICCAVLVEVSLLTPPPRPEQVDGLTFGGEAKAVEPRSPHHALTVWLSLALLTAVAAVWLLFRG